MLKAQEPTREAIFAALRAGEFYATQGPTIESVEIDDTAVRVECSPAVECFAVCPMPGSGSTNWRVSDERVARTSYELPLRAGTEPVRICIVDEAGRRAWTNPHWNS